MHYKHNYDKILTRLVSITQKLYNNALLSISQLATEFNVSTKTIERDMKRLISFPIEKQGRLYKIQDGFSLEKTKDKVLEWLPHIKVLSPEHLHVKIKKGLRNVKDI